MPSAQDLQRFQPLKRLVGSTSQAKTDASLCRVEAPAVLPSTSKGILPPGAPLNCSRTRKKQPFRRRCHGKAVLHFARQRLDCNVLTVLGGTLAVAQDYSTWQDCPEPRK